MRATLRTATRLAREALGRSPAYRRDAAPPAAARRAEPSGGSRCTCAVALSARLPLVDDDVDGDLLGRRRRLLDGDLELDLAVGLRCGLEDRVCLFGRRALSCLPGRRALSCLLVRRAQLCLPGRRAGGPLLGRHALATLGRLPHHLARGLVLDPFALGPFLALVGGGLLRELCLALDVDAPPGEP